MTKSLEEMRDRLITASLRYAAAERGGLDNENAKEELKNSLVDLNNATCWYYAELMDRSDGS